jgi:amidase/aspartyl-tRNA(Asn)/glutamyl-tRNA(Gln) amidotransferase subunit A
VSGPIARSVADVALAMRVLAGPHPGDRYSLTLPGSAPFGLNEPLPKRLRVAWYPSLTGDPVEPAVERGVADALERWAGHSGGTVKLVRPAVPYLQREESKALRGSLETVVGVDLLGYGMSSAGLKSVAELAARADQLSPTFRRLGWAASSITLADYLQAQAAITTFCEEAAASAFANCDLIACPTLAVPPFSRDLELGPDRVNGEAIDPHLGWTFTWPFNLTGEPAVSLPCGWTADGLPLGLQLVGRRGDDGLVLRAAAAVERLVSRPPLPRLL